MFEFFEGTKLEDLSDEYIYVLENADENAIGIGKPDYDEITNEHFFNKIIEVQKIKNPEKLVIGAWPYPLDQPSGIPKLILENKELFSNLKSLFVGDVGNIICEISWMLQEDYTEFLREFKTLEHLTIEGSQELAIRDINHKNLKSLELITGGLPAEIIHNIVDGNLPNLEKLSLYIGSEEYGFDGNIDDIKYLMDNLHKLPKLKSLGLLNSEMQDDIVKLVISHPNIKNLEVLDLSYGTFTDIGAQFILENKDKIAHLQTLVLKRSFICRKYRDELSQLDVNVNLEEHQYTEIDWEKAKEEGTDIEDLYYDFDIYPLYTE